MASNRRILTKLAGELQATRTGMGSQLHGVYRGYTYVVKPGTGSGKKMMMVAFFGFQRSDTSICRCVGNDARGTSERRQDHTERI